MYTIIQAAVPYMADGSPQFGKATGIHITLHKKKKKKKKKGTIPLSWWQLLDGYISNEINQSEDYRKSIFYIIAEPFSRPVYMLFTE